MKTLLTHGAIVWVCGDRKCTLSTTTVTHILEDKYSIPILQRQFNNTYLNVSNIIVNNTNLPSKGTTKDVGGIISANSKKNTVSDSKMLMDRLT